MEIHKMDPLSLQTAWKTRGAPTKEAIADDSVAAKQPA
jgi:hypothetical protein